MTIRKPCVGELPLAFASLGLECGVATHGQPHAVGLAGAVDVEAGPHEGGGEGGGAAAVLPLGREVHRQAEEHAARRDAALARLRLALWQFCGVSRVDVMRDATGKRPMGRMMSWQGRGPRPGRRPMQPSPASDWPCGTSVGFRVLT